MGYFAETFNAVCEGFFNKGKDDSEKELKRVRYEADKLKEVHSKDKNKIPNFYDKYWMYSLFLHFYDISRSEFESMCKSGSTTTIGKLQGYDIDEFPDEESSKYIISNSNDAAYELNCSANSGIAYNLSKHQFVLSLDDWTAFKVLSYDEFKNSCKKWMKWDKVVKSDKLLGYNMIK